MAFVSMDSNGTPFYPNNVAVGSGAPNKRDDVLLVQRMRHRIHIDSTAGLPAG